MIDYTNLKFFLRVARLGIECAGEVNSNKQLQKDSENYSSGLTKQQEKILAHIKVMESDFSDYAMVKRNIAKLEKLMGSKIPEKAFTTVNIN